MSEEYNTSRFILSVREVLHSAYRKWNSIIYDMDESRKDLQRNNNLLLKTGFNNIELRSTGNTSEDPGIREVLIKEHSDFRNKLFIGNTTFNTGGILRNTGGSSGDIFELDIPSPPNTGESNLLVFVEVWREEIFPEDDIYKGGHLDKEIERQSEDEFLLRTRWRFRVVSNIDFETYPSGMLDTNVTVLASNDSPTEVGYNESDIDNLYTADNQHLDVYENKVYATPLLKIKRIADENYLDINNVEVISGKIASFLHSHQHHAGEEDEINPSDINAIPTSSIGSINGVAPLDENGKLPKEYLDDDISSDINSIETSLNSHKENKDNPHEVSHSQVGAVSTGRRVDTGTGLSGGGSLTIDRNLSVDTNYFDGRYAGISHESNENNPHSVTKSQVDLGSVPNVDLTGDVSGKVERSGDVMDGVLVAQNNTSYETKQVRNIIISKNEPSGGSEGDIWIRY